MVHFRLGWTWASLMVAGSDELISIIQDGEPILLKMKYLKFIQVSIQSLNSGFSYLNLSDLVQKASTWSFCFGVNLRAG